ncbi:MULTISPECIES: hypothetical protein [unclassified Sphingobacterium]|uniref:hypothetical protein n=1 Tax=unclassified Sphingobacterium TaxID=2609468 RepID=UPI0025DC28CC|nr:MULTISPECIES: hypothetical protein [unclassified Sphingobacterium]
MKSNHILYTVISIVCVFLTQYETRAQGPAGQKPEVIRLPDPQPPNAAELGKYGVYPAAEYTGVLPVSIPLFEISVGGKSLPFSLNYHASGIKVSQRETEVGLGWSLS